MAETFAIEIVTPERLVVKDSAEEAQIPGKNGYMGILPGHAPLISELAVGEISVSDSWRHEPNLGGVGLCRSASDRTDDSCGNGGASEEIDIARAEKAKERAEKKLADGNQKKNAARHWVHSPRRKLESRSPRRSRGSISLQFISFSIGPPVGGLFYVRRRAEIISIDSGFAFPKDYKLLTAEHLSERAASRSIFG